MSAAKIPLSLVIIAKNEADRIERCIRSVPFADDVLVVDSGSVDATRALSLAAGARVIDKTDWTGFGDQKRFAVEQARNDWVLCLDADEWLDEELRQRIPDTLRAGGARVYALPRKQHFMGRWLNHGQGYPEWMIRLFDRRHAQWNTRVIHEAVETGERVARIRGALLHRNVESLGELIGKHNRYTDMQVPHVGGGTGRLVVKCLVSPVARFLRLYVLRLGLLDGVPGFVHAMLDAFVAFMKYAKVIEKRYRDR